VMALQPPSGENGTSQSDVDIPGERDRRYGPPPSKRSDDDDDDGPDMYSSLCVLEKLIYAKSNHWKRGVT